jgi:hypothetical protein
MRITGRRGRRQLRLEAVEVALLETLLAELSTLVADDGDHDDPVVARLYPAAYRSDDDAEDEFRSLTRDSLRADRLARIAACVQDLDGADASQATDVDIADPETGERWIKALNDLRLALGTRLGVTEDDGPEDVDADGDPAPGDHSRLVYHWLTAVQDSVVTSLTG